MSGCNEGNSCSYHGPAMNIYDNMHYSSDALKEYARSFQYLKESHWEEDSDKEEWEKHAKHIMFSSFFQNQLNLSEEDFVEVIFDDFSDIDNS